MNISDLNLSEARDKIDLVFESLKKIVEYLEVGIESDNFELSLRAVVAAIQMAFLSTELTDRIQESLNKWVLLHHTEHQNGH